MTRLNLLPWREMRRKEQDQQLLRIGGASALLMALIVFYGYWHASLMVEGQTKRNGFLQEEIAKVDRDIKEINELKKQREALIARMRVIEQLQGDRTQIVHLFDDLVQKFPEGIYLTSLKQTGKSLTLQGAAQSNGRISTLMRNLDSSNWFASPDLDVINVKAQASERVSEFTLRVNQANKAAKAAEEPKQP